MPVHPRAPKCKRPRSLRGPVARGARGPSRAGDYSAAEAFLAAFLAACFFTFFLAGVVTGAAASPDAAVAAGAAGAAAAGVAAKDRLEPKRAVAMHRAVMLDLMTSPINGDVCVAGCYVGYQPTERNCKDANLGLP